MKQFGIGQPVRRVEDRRFITGHGNYVDDISRPARPTPSCCARRMRMRASPAIDAAAALAAPGVLAVFTGEDLARDGIGGDPLPQRGDQPRRVAVGAAAASGDRARPGAACRRHGRDGRGGDRRRGARRSRADRRRLRTAARRRRYRARPRSGPTASMGRGAGQSMLRLGDRRPRRGRAGDGRRRAIASASSSSTTGSSSIRWSRAAPSANTIRARMPTPCGARPRARISSATCSPPTSSRFPRTASAS